MQKEIREDRELPEVFVKSFIDSEKMVGSIFFYGAKKSGKLLAAKKLAAVIIGREGIQDFINWSDPDLLYLEAINKDSQIDAVRDLIKWISYKPYGGKKKVVIINNADSLSLESSNALLKTLEEPPEDTTIILVAKSYLSLPRTIISRCQLVNFDRLGDYESGKITGDTTPRWRSMLGLSEADFGKAIDFLNKSKLERIAQIKEFNLEELVDLLVWIFRELYMHKFGYDGLSLIAVGKQPLWDLSARYENDQVIGIQKELLRIQSYLKTNINQKILADSLLFIV